MLDYIQNPHKYEKCGYNAKEYFRRSFTKEIFIDRIENGIPSISSKMREVCVQTDISRAGSLYRK